MALFLTVLESGLVFKLSEAKETSLPNVNLGVAWGSKWELLSQTPAPHLSSRLSAVCLALGGICSPLFCPWSIKYRWAEDTDNGDTGKRVWQGWEGTSHLHIKAGFPKVVISWALKESFLEDEWENHIGDYLVVRGV